MKESLSEHPGLPRAIKPLTVSPSPEGGEGFPGTLCGSLWLRPPWGSEACSPKQFIARNTSSEGRGPSCLGTRVTACPLLPVGDEERQDEEEGLAKRSPQGLPGFRKAYLLLCWALSADSRTGAGRGRQRVKAFLGLDPHFHLSS